MIENELKKNDESIRIIISRGIKHFREKAEMSQKDLMWTTKIDKEYISRLENNRSTPNIMTIYVLTKGMGITLKEFFNWVYNEIKKI